MMEMNLALEPLLTGESSTETVEDLLPPANSFNDIDDLYELLNEDFADIDQNVELYLECNDDEIETITLDTGCQNTFSGIKPCPINSGHNRVAVNIPTGQNSVYRLTFPGEEVNTSIDRDRFQCDLCVKSFARKSLLLDHKSVAHKITDLFVCNKCAYKGQRYRHWYKHMKRKHAACAISVDHISCEQPTTNGDHGNSDISRETLRTACDDHIPHEPPNVLVDHTSSNHSNIDLDNQIQCELTATINADQVISYMPECSTTVSGDHVFSELTKTINSPDAYCVEDQACETVRDCTRVAGVEEVTSVSRVSTVGLSKSLDVPEMTVQLPHVVIDNEIKAGSIAEKNLEPEKYFCPACSKTFDKKRSLMYHKRIHVEDRAYLCLISECRKAFKTISALNEHKTTVHGAKVYKCQHQGCTKVYAFKRDLTYHQKGHEQCYQCRHAGCGKVFRDPYNLSMHTKTHTGQKTVQCPKCDFACIQKNSLNWHLRTKHEIENIST